VSPPTLAREETLWGLGAQYVVGLDEVGRGPLAGPVVAAAVVFKPGQKPIDGIRDSKQMTARRRTTLAGVVRLEAFAYGIGAASSREIERLNILQATALAMRRALSKLPFDPDHILVDGNPMPAIQKKHEAIVKGDSISMSIAAASILAKVTRDKLMVCLHGRYPQFGWDRNMGYGTKEHMDAILSIGPTPHHRHTFSPISQLHLI